MSPDIYRQAGALFDRLRELPDKELASALDATCGGNAELRAQVMRLIEADRSAGGRFLEGRAVEDAARLLETPALPAAGTVIGNYRLVAQIGAGGMGVVYEGRDMRLDRPVAVKILPQTFAAEADERIQRFQREARAVSTLNHPHIVSIFDADFNQGYHYIAMEYVEGKTLRQLAGAQAPPLDSQTILDWVGQTASALSAAHEAGIVHRDIKPENIMIRPDGFVKVLDFGLAKLREPVSGAVNASDFRTRPGNLAGTIQYLSPEQIQGEPAGSRSDLFSLGVVAYELATGVRPFDGPTDGAVFNAILSRTPPPPSIVRPSLGTELDGLIMRALEKDPELRFQTAGDLRSSCRRVTRDYIAKAIDRERETGQQHPSVPALTAVPAKPARGRRSRPLVAVAGLAAVVGASFLWLTRPLPPPRVTRIVQITSDRRPKQYFVNDGTRLYYAGGNEDSDIKIFQVSTKGGEPVPMPQLTGMFPLDISPDHSELLLGRYAKGNAKDPYAIWVAATLGGAPRRLGDLMADDARWSPKGDEILCSNGPEMWIARNDGSESRQLVTLKGILQAPAWSPDGRSIRFTLLAKNSTALWEVAADGSHPHALYPDLGDHPNAGGVWTPDGKYFVFSFEQATRDLWAARQGKRLFATGATGPVRLTTGPMMAYHPEASPDGHRVFFLGGLDHGELVRYDRRSDQWVPYLGGLEALELDYSRDGKWVTYTSYPEGSVWRSALDGSERLQLTAPPLHAMNPRWSPDGTQITFYGGLPGKPARVYVVPTTGGAVRQLTHGEGGPSGDVDGSWSPDGAALVFAAQSADQRRDRWALEIIDVKTRRVSTLPESQGLWSPRWSPDGRYIAALGSPIFKLWLYNVETHARTELTDIGAGWPSWSRDSQYIYFENNATTVWYCVRIKDGRVERLASMSGLKMAPSSLGWIGLTPDGSLIATREVGSTEIYALDWDAP
jgi:eukaryotic-like serine/threonine-protein kinase